MQNGKMVVLNVKKKVTHIFTPERFNLKLIPLRMCCQRIANFVDTFDIRQVWQYNFSITFLNFCIYIF